MNSLIIYLLIYATIILSSAVVFIGVRYAWKLGAKNLILALVPALALFVLSVVLRVQYFLINDAIIFIFTIFAGCLIGLAVKSDVSLIIFLITASIADFLSFNYGLTNMLFEGYQNGQNSVLVSMSVSFPLDNKTVPVAGFGDYLVMCSIFAALERIGGYTVWQRLLPPLAGFTAAVTVGLIVGGVYAIPFIAAATILTIVCKRKAGRRK